MKQNKGLKPGRNAHTANTKYGMGDYYGSGIKQKVGTFADTIKPIKKSQAPRSLA